MTFTIDLTPEEVRRIPSAQARGLDVTAMIRGLLASLPETPEEDRTLALLARWREEDATDDPEELARRDAELEEFKASMNANRTECVEEPLYP